MLYWAQKFSGDLMIRNIQLNHAGKYVCIIDTDVESLSADAVLIVEGNISRCYIYYCCIELFFKSYQAGYWTFMYVDLDWMKPT